MSFDEVISDTAKVVEAVGAGIMIVGGLAALIVFASSCCRPSYRLGAYARLRQNLAKVILLGLEILIVGDIVRTIIVDPTLESVAVLGLIVVIRIILSFSLEVEVEGTWPWARWRLQERTDLDESPPGSVAM
jgi:uncharacterized membrane protein